jgi:hypothetical protein
MTPSPTPDDRDDEQDDWDDWDDAEDDPGDGAEELEDEPTVPCPSCRREILEDSPRCPYCERYLSAEDHTGPGRPAWIIVTALICLGIAVWWVLRAF